MHLIPPLPTEGSSRNGAPILIKWTFTVLFQGPRNYNTSYVGTSIAHLIEGVSFVIQLGGRGPISLHRPIPWIQTGYRILVKYIKELILGHRGTQFSELFSMFKEQRVWFVLYHREHVFMTQRQGHTLNTRFRRKHSLSGTYSLSSERWGHSPTLCFVAKLLGVRVSIRLKSLWKLHTVRV